MNRSILVTRIFLIIILANNIFSCSQDSSNSYSRETSRGSARQNSSENREYTNEYKMATINKGGYLSKDDPTIEDFKLILDRLQTECQENKSLIADMIVKAWDIYKKDTGRNVSLLWIAQQLNNSVPSGTRKVVKFAEVAAAWLTLASN